MPYTFWVGKKYPIFSCIRFNFEVTINVFFCLICAFFGRKNGKNANAPQGNALYTKASKHQLPHHKKDLADLKILIHEDGGDITLDDLDDSTINDLLNAMEEERQPKDDENMTQKSDVKGETKRLHGKRNSASIISSHTLGRKSNVSKHSYDGEEWKWKEPTDDEDDYDDDDQGLTLKVHSAILDESINISNLDVSFNAACRNESGSLLDRKRAEKNKQKVSK